MRHKQKYSVIVFVILVLGLCHTVSAQCSNSSNPDPHQLNSVAQVATCARLGCVSNTELSQEEIQKHIELLDAGLDLYAFMISNQSLRPVENLTHEIRTSHSVVGGLSDARFIRVWFKVSLRPQLPFLSRDYLSCLSKGNLSCESYQALVMELSEHMKGMEAGRMMVYKHLIVPFLSGNSSGGCVQHSNNSEDWLMRNFQTFASFALIRDLIKLNMNFSGLETLEKLTPEQKAELILNPKMGDLDNHTIIQVLQSLIQPLLENQHSNQSVLNTTTAAPMNSTNVGNPQDQTDPVLKQFLPLLKPLGSFINKLVSTVHKENISSIKSHILTQVVVNWTLSELAGFFTHNFTLRNQMFIGKDPSSQTFNVTEVDDWFQHVVVPMLKRFLPSNQKEVLNNLTTIFHHVFELNGSMDPEPFDSTKICRLNNNSTCSVSQTAENLAVVFRCVANTNMNVTKETIKSLVTGLRDRMKGTSRPKVTHLSTQLPAVTFSPEQLRDVDLIQFWADVRLTPALSMLSEEYASCLSTQNFSCKAFQAIVHSLAKHVTDRREQKLVYTEFIKSFLSRKNTQDPGCLNSVNDSRQWLENFQPFFAFASLKELNQLNRNFSAMDVLPLLTLAQLGETALTPNQLRDPEDVKKILSHVKDDQLGDFFDVVSPAIQDLNLTQDVRSAMLKQVFDRANLSSPSVNDSEVLVWLDRRLRPLLPNMQNSQVQPFFGIIKHRECNTTQQGVNLLNSVRPTLMSDTQKNIQTEIVKTLKGLRCYKNNSFYVFLKDAFVDFELPKLTTVLSLIPPERKPEVINSFRPSELGALLRQLDLVDNETALCTVLNSYNRTPEFLEKEEVLELLRRPILPCVWPLALAAEDEAEADKWFSVRLKPYIPFLNKELLSSADTLHASCLPFQKLVSFLSTNHSFNGSDFTQEEAYDTIKTYLNSDAQPKCYNATNPRLNSTAWFVNYIGGFVIFVTRDDLDTFGSEDTLKQFTVNPLNIKLFTKNGVPESTSERYTQLIFLENPNFNPLQLPPVFQCGAPAAVYSTLTENASLSILGNLNQTCTNVPQEISSALAGNIKTVNADTISALGPQVVGLTTAQITSASPSVILNSLPTFSSVSGWSQGQVITIIKVLIQQNFQINSVSNLVKLGTLVGGVPSRTFESVTPTVALQTAQNPTFVANLQNASSIVQQTFVKQIIKVDADPQKLLTNIPDSMAFQIPRNLLIFQNSGNVTTVAKNINKKKWKQEQAVLFFDTVANGFDDTDELSEDVLQGFTCSRVRTFKKTKIKGLIKACRRRKGRRKVYLKQTQLTCMYNFIKADKPTDFVNYSSDMLLYYKYADIPKASCKSYFTEAGTADFTILTRALKGRRAILLENAKQCLGIEGVKINRQNVEVLGNMVCNLDQSYIQNSDSEILENMKNCKDITDQQSSAIQTVLFQGNTKYGPPSRWREKTLDDLGILPLYFSHDFWKRYSTRTKRNFLKRFLRSLRRRKTAKRKLKRFFKQLLRGLRIKRGADECTVGNITRVTISDDAFPFGYDATQFRHCLSAKVVKENLASLAEKVDDDDFQRVILDRLNEAFPSGLQNEEVQLLGSVSRVATTTDMSKWNISSSDTLAALMNSDDGEWEADKSKFIVNMFLRSNSLGSTELNILGGPNLCVLDASTLSGISSDSIKGAGSLDVSNCTTEKKKALFEIAKQAFPITFTNRNTDTLTSYQFLQPFLGGASLDFIKGLSSSNVSMDIETFTDLDETVILDLTVSEVANLLGNNLPDLESYQEEPVIKNWISRQFQSELDTLNLNLTGGKADPVTTSSNSNATTAAATVAATTVAVSAGIKGSSYSFPFIFLMMNLAFIKIQFV